MTTSAQMRRLEDLESTARVQRFEESLEAELEAIRPHAEEIAEVVGCSADGLIAETVAIARRIAEVGEEQWEAETAAARGVTVDELRRQYRDVDLDAEREARWAWEAFDRARRAEVVTYRGGIAHKGGQMMVDANGQPIKLPGLH